MDRQRLRYIAVRNDALTGYGGRCTCCGTDDRDVLDIDHIAPVWHGLKTGRPLEEVGGYTFYRRLAREGFPEGYQLLCRNCNWSKRLLGACHLSHTDAPACYLRPTLTATQRHAAKLRREMLAAYGRHCALCSNRDEDVLDLDHVRGGGGAERRAGETHKQLWVRLRREGFPKGEHRLLCRNCNWKEWCRLRLAGKRPQDTPGSAVA